MTRRTRNADTNCVLDSTQPTMTHAVCRGLVSAAHSGARVTSLWRSCTAPSAAFQARLRQRACCRSAALTWSRGPSHCAGAAAVLAGAYGAHNFGADKSPYFRGIFENANRYHLLHSAVLALAPAASPRPHLARLRRPRGAPHAALTTQLRALAPGGRLVRGRHSAVLRKPVCAWCDRGPPRQDAQNRTTGRSDARRRLGRAGAALSSRRQLASKASKTAKCMASVEGVWPWKYERSSATSPSCLLAASTRARDA